MDESKRIEFITDYLNEHKFESFFSLDNKTRDLMFKKLMIIETRVQEILEEKESALKAYRKVKIYPANIATKGLSRAYIYSYKILEDYIASRSVDLNNLDVSSPYNSNLASKDEKIMKLNETIDKLRAKDLDIQLYKDRIEELENELAKSQSDLEKTVANDFLKGKEINRLKSELKLLSGNVIDINSKRT